MSSIPGDSSIFVYAMTFLATAYAALKAAIEKLLEETVFKANPQLASQYAEGVSILVALTAIYLILEFVSSAKRIVRAVLVLGWVLLIVALVISSGSL